MFFKIIILLSKPCFLSDFKQSNSYENMIVADKTIVNPTANQKEYGGDIAYELPKKSRTEEAEYRKNVLNNCFSTCFQTDFTALFRTNNPSILSHIEQYKNEEQKRDFLKKYLKNLCKKYNEDFFLQKS